MKVRPRKLEAILKNFGLYVGNEFRHILEYEKLRTKRNNIEFSLVSVDVNLDLLTSRSLGNAINRIIRQLRITDHIGWVEPNQIGIILPGTDAEGALGFIKNIDPVISRTIGLNIEEVATYPETESASSAISAAIPPSVDEDSDNEAVSVIPFEIAE